MDFVKNIFNCDKCKYTTKSPSDWIKHIKCKKHQRNGEKLPIKCDKCDYTGITHWNLKMHLLSIHSTKEERIKCKYYCVECDRVFFCSTYFNSHNNSTKHKNMVFIKNNLTIN
jgi:hypothetical protein